MLKLARLASTSALVRGSPRPLPFVPQRGAGRQLPERFQRDRNLPLAHADAGIADAQHRLAAVVQRG